MATCINCGAELLLLESGRLGETCDKFECWEAAYCHEPVDVKFEKIDINDLVQAT